MPEFNHNFTAGKMNKDLDERMVPNGQYRDAMNIEVTTSEGSNIGTVQSTWGNTQVNLLKTALTPDDKCIGSYAWTKENKIIWLIASAKNTPDRHDQILEYNADTGEVLTVFSDYWKISTFATASTSTTSLFVNDASRVMNTMTWEALNPAGGVYGSGKVTTSNPGTGEVTLDAASTSNIPSNATIVFQNPRTLKFETDQLITGINIIDDLLFWTDNVNEPRKLNITRAKIGSDHTLAGGRTMLMRQGLGVTSFNEEHLTVIKKSPTTAPVLTMSNTLRPDLNGDGSVVTKTLTTTSFTDGVGELLTNGDTGSFTTTGANPDYQVGDFLFGHLEDDESDYDNLALIRILVTSVSSSGNGTVIGYEIVFISTDTPSAAAQWTIKLAQGDPLFEFKFPRFAYRWKYEDGEYSCYSPFSEVAFIPDEFDYFPKKGYNLGMTNNLRYLVISGFVPEDIPLDVIEVDVLYKESSSTNIYTVKTIKNKALSGSTSSGAHPADKEWQGKIRTSAGTFKYFPNSTVENASTGFPVSPALFLTPPTGALKIESELVHALTPSNQLLRPWDNVPRKALAQDVSANRIIYGNYIQNFDLTTTEGGNTLTPKFMVSMGTRKHTPSSLNYEHGVALTGYSSNNLINPQPKKPEKSIKSLRKYQFGIVFMDAYGRQTPVLTDDTATITVPKSYADQYSKFIVRLDDGSGVSPSYPSPPYWAKYFKYYIKETSNEYYNLALDRLYDAEDGNVWLSFPSSERNKVDEETFLILKKQHDADIFVEEKARYKILAISNEAPLFIKLQRKSLGDKQVTFGVAGEPRRGKMFIDIPTTSWTGSTFTGADDKSPLQMRISTATIKSKYYDIVNITTSGSYKRIAIKLPFGHDLDFTVDSSNNLVGGLSLEIVHVIAEDRAEFDGRFFVKIYKDTVLQENISLAAPVKEYTVSHALQKIARTDTTSTTHSQWSKPRYDGWFLDEADAKGTHGSVPSSLTGANAGWWNNIGGGNYDNGRGIFNGNVWIDLSYTHIGPEKVQDWDLTSGSIDASVRNAHKKSSTLLRTVGTLFRWAGDTTVYRIVAQGNGMLENYDSTDNGSGGWKYKTNKRFRHRIKVEPPIGSTSSPNADGSSGTGKDAIGGLCTGVNPKSSALTGASWWKNFGESGNPAGASYRGIEFLEELVSYEGFLSDNPAIFETEPKEDIGLDIYYEASDAYPIGSEHTYYGSWQPLDWHNCYSYANGVESNRIRDDYNAVTVDKGPKASTVLAEQYKEERRASGMIFSGIYNSTSGINNLNQFIQAEPITKDLNPTYGSIQKLYARNTDIIALCEDKILKILSNKDALYNANGSTNVTSNNAVLGQSIPFSGEYGISKNPESFAAEEYRAYFTDKDRGAVIRLSKDGLTNIATHGMEDWFRDNLRFPVNSIIGSYDSKKLLYNVSIDKVDKVVDHNATVLGAENYEWKNPVTSGLTPGSTNNGDWAAFTTAGTLQVVVMDNIAYVDISAEDANGNSRSAWLDALVTGVSSGGGYNLSIAEFGQLGIESIYSITSVTGPTASSGSGNYYRVNVSHISGLTPPAKARVRISYFTPSAEEDPTDYTVSFSENAKGWTSFKSFLPENGVSINNRYFTYQYGNMWEHHTNSLRNNYYGVSATEFSFSRVCVIFNDQPNSVKNFSALNYNGSQSKVTVDVPVTASELAVGLSLESADGAMPPSRVGQYYNNYEKFGWYASSIDTDLESGYIPEFKKKEGMWFNYIRGNETNELKNLNEQQFSTQGIGKATLIEETEEPDVEFTLDVTDLADID